MMPYRILGMRLGVQVSTASGMARNGDLTAHQRDELKAAGYRLIPCDGVPEAVPTSQEREEMAAANKLLGVATREDGRTVTERQIEKRMSDILKPLTKKFYST